MKNKRIRLLVIVVGGLLALLLVAAIALPLLVDVNRYRGLIEERAEEVLQRDVRLGEMSLSILPLGVKVEDVALAARPEEGGGDLIAARSLRVGAKLLPLLRKRLEVTSITVEGPSLTLERGVDGVWNVERLLPPGEADAGAAAGGGPPPVVVDHLRIRDGSVLVRDHLAGGAVREVTIGSLDLTIDDLALDRETDVELSAEVAGARVRATASAGPFSRPADAPLHVAGHVELSGLRPDAVRDLAAAAGLSLPPDLLGGEQLDLQADGSFSSAAAGQPGELGLERLVLDGLDVTLRRAGDGSWNYEALLADGDGGAAPPAAGGAEAAAPATRVVVGNVRIGDARVHLLDPGANLDLTADGLEVVLEGSPMTAPSNLDLQAAVELSGERVASLVVRGTVGPIEDGRAGSDLRVELSDARMAPLAAYLQEELGVGIRSGTLDLALEVEGTLVEDFQVSGTVDIRKAEATFPGTDGAERSARLDVQVFGDVAVAGAGDHIEFRSLDLTLAGNRMGFAGTVDRSGPQTRVDVRLQPTRIRADDLAALLALAAFEPPVAFSSSEPIEIQARVHGPIGGETYPEVDGRLALRGFSFRHPSMARPLEDVQGTVELQGDSVDITGFAARIGNSDIGGTLSLRGFDKPRVRFAMQSKKADFWELMSFVSGPEAGEGEAPEPAAAGEGEFLGDVVAEGTLRIEEGSFRTLDFTGLDAGMKLEGQVVTLDPFRMSLYDGTFQGAATLDLAQDPPAFTVRSDVERLDVNGILADNLDLDGMISGRFRASLQASGSGADYDAIARSLAGGGTVLVTQGQVGALDMLDILSQVTGVFGEQTLQSMASRFAAEGTPFDRLSATLQLGGGRMRSDNLLLESPDLVIQGTGSVDLLAATLDGDFDVIFSPAISSSMRAEGSRAAKAFWDPGKDQVLLPLGLSGPFASPTPSVDWSTAAENVARRELEAEAKKRLGGLGGLVSGGEAGSGSRSQPAPEDAGAAGDLVAEIARVRWGGSFLMKDLKIEGVVRGSNISQASLVILDASGRELRRIDRLDEVDSYFGSGVPRSDYASISWDATVDGKVLARAEQPFTVVLTLQDTEGHQVEARTEARR